MPHGLPVFVTCQQLLAGRCIGEESDVPSFFLTAWSGTPPSLVSDLVVRNLCFLLNTSHHEPRPINKKDYFPPSSLHREVLSLKAHSVVF